MADDVFEFLWDVHQAGYRWVETRPAPDRMSDPNQYEPEMFLMDPDAESVVRNLYNPLQEHTGLFREFADTAPTPDGILGFANRFGRLGGRAEEGNLLGRGERFRTWVSAIRQMQEAVKIWDMIRAGDTKGLSRIIEWDGEYAVRRRLPDSPELPYQVIASGAVFQEFLQLFRQGDLIQPALVALQQIINGGLGSSPRLLWNHKRGRLELRIVPDSLIGAMWLQFARAVDGNKTYRRCAECQTWFAISPETARVTRTYCSNACRSKAYRKRQSEAERLHAEGVSIENIAHRLDSDTKTVTKWVGGQR